MVKVEVEVKGWDFLEVRIGDILVSSQVMDGNEEALTAKALSKYEIIDGVPYVTIEEYKLMQIDAGWRKV